jgi:general secretion pathway protein D
MALLSFAASLAVLLAPVQAHAQSAHAWNKKAEAAELHEDWDTAYEDYRQAHLKASHIDRGRVLKQSGDIPAALAEFTRALTIDPSNQAAQQEINLIVHPEAAPASKQPVPGPNSIEQTPFQAQTLRAIDSVAAPVELKPVSNDPITFHAVEDTKNIYIAIGKLAGLNVLFDPEYQSKRIPVDLNNVSLFDALRIVGTLANTFYKPVTSNTILVATNTKNKHTDFDDLAVQTFYLTNAAAAADLQEVNQTVRQMLDPTVKIYAVPSQNAIIMRATPDQLLLAQKIINDLDRARAEVVVDIAILEVNRDRIRNLGITLPQSITLTPQASPTSTTSTTTSSTSTSTTPSTFTLNTLANTNATNFAVTIGGGALNALLTDSDTRILQNPRIRSTDGQPAVLKIGSRIPVATGSYSSGVSTGTVALGVQTQFTYVDIGVNISMTPTVHFDHEIGLKLKIEVTSQAGSQTISGVTEPIIAQRTIDQIIQLKEGEPSILAGILIKQDNHALSGTPGLAELPILKYIFGSMNAEKQQDEVVFLVIPHIVREALLTTLNTNPIDSGTLNDYNLSRKPVSYETPGEEGADAARNLLTPAHPASPAPGSVANIANSVVQQMAHDALPPTPPGTTPTGVIPPPANLAPAGPVTFSVIPSGTEQTTGSTFQVSILAANAHDLYAVPLQLQFDPKVLQLVNVDAGELLGRGGQAVAMVHRDEGNGMVTISSSRPPNVPGVDGQGSICTLTFKAIAPGNSALSLVKVGARNSNQTSLPATGSQATVHVK